MFTEENTDRVRFLGNLTNWLKQNETKHPYNPPKTPQKTHDKTAGITKLTEKENTVRTKLTTINLNYLFILLSL